MFDYAGLMQQMMGGGQQQPSPFGGFGGQQQDILRMGGAATAMVARSRHGWHGHGPHGRHDGLATPGPLGPDMWRGQGPMLGMQQPAPFAGFGGGQMPPGGMPGRGMAGGFVPDARTPEDMMRQARPGPPGWSWRPQRATVQSVRTVGLRWTIWS